MRVLLLAGLGPSVKNSEYLDGTLFDRRADRDLEQRYQRIAGRAVDLNTLCYVGHGRPRRLLRPARMPLSNLTAAALCSILDASGVDYQFFPLEKVWEDEPGPGNEEVDLVGLSTTFICNRQTLNRAIDWISSRYPDATLVLGGQYSNLKYRQILREMPQVQYILRGDGESALPRLLEALRGKAPLARVPNLAGRVPYSDEIFTTEIEYVDLDGCPSPVFAGDHDVVLYESMRGCPFTCKFCSYPAASPEWRYKSVAKIAGDWRTYRDVNHAELIRAMDSTFTVPAKRLAELLQVLPDIGVRWEAYARPNDIHSPELVRALEAAHCQALSFGFESMSDATLIKMNKRATAEHNHRAMQLIAGSRIDFRTAFMVGYPGETVEDYETTHRFIVEQFRGRFLLSVFSLMDETMPVWEDAGTVHLQVLDPREPALSWKHAGMDVDTAYRLLYRTLDDARRNNEDGVLLLWQLCYELPLVADLPPVTNRRIEKLIERLAFLAKDHKQDDQARSSFEAITLELCHLGIRLDTVDCGGEPT